MAVVLASSAAAALMAVAIFVWRRGCEFDKSITPSFRRSDLLAVGVVLLLAFPQAYLLPGLFGQIHLASIPLAFWSIMAVRSSRHPTPGLTLAVIALSALGVSSAIGGIRPAESLIYAVHLLVTVLGFGVVLAGYATERDRKAIRRGLEAGAWIVVTISSVELVLGVNPIFGAFFETSGRIVQNWDTYRVTGSLGHPLYVGAIVAALLTRNLVELARGVSVHRLVQTMGLTIVLLASGARSGVVALVAGLAAATVMRLRSPVSPLRERAKRRSAAPLLVGAALIGAVLVFSGATDLFVQRSQSYEAIASSRLRAESVGEARELVSERPALGFGIGAAAYVSTDQVGVARRLSLENSWLELAVGAGLPFSFTFLGLVVFCAARRGGSEHDRAAVFSFIVAMAGFNLLEGNWNSHYFLGIILMASAASPGGRERGASWSSSVAPVGQVWVGGKVPGMARTLKQS